MISKERLLQIDGLKLSDKIDNMSALQIEEYGEALGAFTDTFSLQEPQLKDYFAAKSYESFTGVLSGVKDALIQLHADELALSCSEMLDNMKAEDHEKLEERLNRLLSSIAILSIDIQMAQHKKEPDCLHAASNKCDHEFCILGVDDVPLFLNGLKMVLHDLPCKFIGVTSGAAALKYTSTHTPDLFIFDLEMPEMNGYELAEKVRESGQKAPIIFLTGNSSKEYVLKAIHAGAADFIIKPINKAHVLKIINKYFAFL